MKAYLINMHLLVPRPRSSTKVKVKYKGYISKKMAVWGQFDSQRYLVVFVKILYNRDWYQSNRWSAFGRSRQSNQGIGIFLSMFFFFEWHTWKIDIGTQSSSFAPVMSFFSFNFPIFFFVYRYIESGKV